MKKRFLALALAFSMLFCTACGSTDNSGSGSNETETTTAVTTTAAPEETTTTTTTATTTETTTTTTTTVTTTEAPVEDTAPKDKNGFDYETGMRCRDGGLLYVIPSYYSKEKDKNSFTAKDSSGTSFIFIGSSGPFNNLEKEQEDTIKEVYKEYVYNTIFGKNANIEIIDLETTEICDFTALKGKINYTSNNGAVFIGYSIMIINTKYGYSNLITYIHTIQTEFDYDQDFERILDAIKVDENFVVPDNKSSSSSKTEKTQTTTQKPVTTPAPTTTTQQKSKEVPIKTTQFFTSTDYKGSPVLVVEYRFTNYEDTEAYFMLLFNDKAYQNGIECKTAFMCDDVDAQAHLTAIQPGASYTVRQAYVLNDTTTDVELIVKPLFSLTNEKYIDGIIHLN